MKDIEGAFGITTLHRIRTREGHTVVWFASGDGLTEDVHERLFTATIKRHDTRGDEKQTIVTRLVEARDEARTKLESKFQKTMRPKLLAPQASNKAA
jgi:hypothetical protein